MESVLGFDQERWIRRTVHCCQEYLHKFDIKKLVIGISGGLDSTVSAKLATLVVGKENVIAVHLPHYNQEESKKEFHYVCDLLDLPIMNRHCIDIRPMLDAYPLPGNTIQMTNMVARIQRAILFDFSHKNNAPVLGTLNRTEHELGEYPIFALEASIQPIRKLFKTQVRLLAEHLGLPRRIQDKIPTIDTWLGKQDQINRARIVEIGLPIVDQILKYHLDIGMNLEEIVNQGFKREDVKFVTWMRNINNYKHILPILAGEVPTSVDSTFLVAIMGGVGAGKSTVSKIFQKLGARMVDADQISRNTCAYPEIRKKLIELFGDRILTDGRIDRIKLGKLVFGDARARRAMELVIHPVVERIMKDEVAAWNKQGAQIGILDIPLLEKSSFRDKVDVVVFVESSLDDRAARVRESRGWSEAEFASRERAQMSLEEKRNMADCIIKNLGTTSLADLERRCKALFESWKKFFRNR